MVGSLYNEEKETDYLVGKVQALDRDPQVWDKNTQDSARCAGDRPGKWKHFLVGRHLHRNEECPASIRGLGQDDDRNAHWLSRASMSPHVRH